MIDGSQKPVHLILLAGGSGSRAGSSVGQPPKQFCATGRGPLFTVSLGEFVSMDTHSGFVLAGVTMAVADSWSKEAEQGLAHATENLEWLPWQLSPAGDTRTASTWQAVQVLEGGYNGKKNGPKPEAGDLVAVHDTARPFASANLLASLAAAASVSGCAVPCIPVPDTIVQVSASSTGIVDSDSRAQYLERNTLQAVQTPQVFRWDIFRSAHAAAAADSLEFTDDGGLLASRGHHPVVVPGQAGNWKITTEADLHRAIELLK